MILRAIKDELTLTGITPTDIRKSRRNNKRYFKGK